jgi:uncharacterized protein VirK/YbjX
MLLSAPGFVNLPVAKFNLSPILTAKTEYYFNKFLNKQPRRNLLVSRREDVL